MTAMIGTLFWWKKRSGRDLEHENRMKASQMALLTAATEAADAAQAVTTILKEKLDDSLKRFEATAKLIDDALILATPEGDILSHNPAASRIFGKASLNHLNIVNLIHHPERQHTAQDLWAEFKAHTRRGGGIISRLKGIRLSDGHIFPIDPACASLDWSDGTRSMLVLIRNQEHLATIQFQMVEAKRQFEALFENSFDGVIVTTGRVIVAANTSVGEIFGRPSRFMLGHDIADFLATDLSVDIQDQDVHCISAIGKHSSGSLRSLVLSSNAIPWNGSTARLISIKDITTTSLASSN